MPTALIVEDEPAANQLLSMLVQLKGYETRSAFRGDEAIEQAGDYRPDVVFLDLMLPDTSGYEVCKALTSRRGTCDIPVVLVTARLADENRVQGFRAGAVEYVPKPYTPDQIFSAISRADSWRALLSDRSDSGRIVLDARDEVAQIRQVSDLRRLLLARSGLAESDVSRAIGGLLEILQLGSDWGKSRGRDLVATLDFRIEPDALALRLRDESGWLAWGGPGRVGLSVPIDRAGFEVADLADATGLALRRPFQDR